MIEGIEFKLEWIGKGNRDKEEEVKLLLKVKGWMECSYDWSLLQKIIIILREGKALLPCITCMHSGDKDDDEWSALEKIKSDRRIQWMGSCNIITWLIIQITIVWFWALVVE